MKHLVFGAGLVGGYLGAALMSSGQSVGWVVRPATRIKLDKGVRVTDFSGADQTLENLQFVDQSPGRVSGISAESSNNSTGASNTGHPAWLWLTTKCTSLATAVEDVRPLVGRETKIICLQNGLGAEAYVKESFPRHEVIRGVMSANVTEIAAGHLHRATAGGIDLPLTEDVLMLKKSFTSELLPLSLHQDLESLLWAKLQLNLNNAINALSDIPLLQQLHDPGYRKILAAMMEELLLVVDAKSIRLPRLTKAPARWLPAVMRLPNWLFLRVAQKMLAIDASARSSMWSDLSSAKQTEIDFLNGALALEGDKVGVDCRINRRLTELVHSAERGELQIGMSAVDLKKHLLL